MASKLAYIDGAFSSSLTWSTGAAGTGAEQAVHTSSDTGLLTSVAWSPAFTLTAGQNITGVLVALRVAGAFTTQTVKVALSADNGATEATSVTINVSDIFNNTTASAANRTFVYAKFLAPLATDGGSDYKLGLQCSANSMVQAGRSSTSADWFRIFSTDATNAPTTGDNLVIAADNASGTRTVTMDNNSTTAFGQLFVGKGGLLTSKTDGTTNLRITNGWVGVQGTLAMGTTTTPVSRSYTATLEMACASDNQYTLTVYGNASFQGQSKTAGKDFNWTLLGVDATSGATTLTITDAVDWKAGDSVVIAPSITSYTSAHRTTLAADTTSTTLTLFTGVNHARTTTPTPAEIINLSAGNVICQATNTSYRANILCNRFSNVDADWFRTYLINNIDLESTDVPSAFDYCAHDMQYAPTSSFQYDASVNSRRFALNKCVASNAGGTATRGLLYMSSYNASLGTPSMVITDCVMIGAGAANNATMIYYGNPGETWTFARNRFAGGLGLDVSCAGNSVLSGHPTIEDCVAHCARYNVVSYSGGVSGNISSAINFDGCSFWGTETTGYSAFVIDAIGSTTTVVTDCYFAGAPNGAVAWVASAYGSGFVEFNNCTFETITAKSTPYGFRYLSMRVTRQVKFNNCTFNPATASFYHEAVGGAPSYVLAVDCTHTTAMYAANAVQPGFFVSWQQQDGTSGTWDSGSGKFEREITVVRTEAPSVKLTPISATFKLPSPDISVAVQSGTSVSVTAYVRKTSTYSGSDPRLIERKNAAVGVDANSVKATFSGSADTWVAVTGTSSVPTADGVLQFYIDCDGTTGSVYVDDWTIV